MVTTKSPSQLAYQLTKYQQRDGWSHRDLLRLSHPKTDDPTLNALFYWATKGWPSVGDEPHSDPNLQLVWAYERAKRATSAEEVAGLVREYGLTHEMLPTQFKTERIVWDALVDDIPITALIRNLATLTRVGVIGRASGNRTSEIAEKLVNGEILKRGRVHPIALLGAQKIYEQGKGERGSNTWDPHPKIVDALNDAFYLSFGNVEPTGKRILLALDVSASMTWSTIGGMPGITPRVGSAAMALVTAAVEPNATIAVFASDALRQIPLSSKQRLTDVVRMIDQLPAGGTDCSLPMTGSLQHGHQHDAFVVYTDSETYAGKIHPSQALKQYRQKTGIPAKLIVCGMVSNGFTIADPQDSGMLDVVGFNTAAPAVMADFISR